MLCHLLLVIMVAIGIIIACAAIDGNLPSLRDLRGLDDPPSEDE